MIIDINLIPQRKKKSYFLLYSLTIIFIVAILSSSLVFLHIHSKKEHILSLEKQRHQIQELIEIENSKLNESQISTSTDRLSDVITLMDNERINSVPLLSHLISLLPERGFFESFSYVLNGDIQLAVQFDTSRDAAYYLHELLQSSWLTDAKIISISTKEDLEEEKQTGKKTFLPRYVAFYQLSINREYIKDIQSEGGSE
ncbi:PilN domain-containing protein [Lederbergia wuyishanensis]|uniref:Type IV pilus assembly protein PilN n=1 Tax=Lederbergia wuyishanensis TaxID=1347903 RepID=A0ABU0D1U7_9BACI|nr:hypothetical protein [Lederbergia wuyishanensis]MCJ8006987.1 hypothetical protein [Lederbergia wuyishanensis]MDQ0342371.1 type IV pilus assembly protein PilN [Lederbergia wuyishanensis]